MERSGEQKSPIEEVMKEIERPKAFKCQKGGSAGIMQSIGANGFLECLEENSQSCQFSLPFEDPPACLCPVRICVASEFWQ
jgi:hypothetical protein